MRLTLSSNCFQKSLPAVEVMVELEPLLSPPLPLDDPAGAVETALLTPGVTAPPLAPTLDNTLVLMLALLAAVRSRFKKSSEYICTYGKSRSILKTLFFKE